MNAILSMMFGTKVQVLVCHWHIRRAWEKNIKSSISTADSKALHKKARVYLSSLMYAKDPEEFYVKWNEFRQCYLVEDITFYTYMFDYYYPKREKWSKAW
ncbi:hypothetical protein BDC45DRAFT_45519 [Circinella umbellata]|nr:hypothetical protein BDC45DRAFT_45519 [Circinella umbellata]